MSFTTQWRNSYVEGNDSLTKTVSIEVDQVDKVSASINPGAVNHEISIAFERAFVKGLYIVCDKDLVLTTNNRNPTAPGDTITLVANEPFVWYAGSGYAMPLTDDVLDIFADRGNPTEAGVATLNIRVARNLPS